MIMKTFKYITLTLIILLAAATCWAVDTDQILARRQQATALPLSDTVILYHGTVFTIYADGRMDREEHIIRYLRNLNAWDEYCDPHLVYHSGRQELDVQISRGHTVDGRKVDTTPNGFNPIVPFGLDKAPDFTDYRQMVVTLLGVEHDVVTELKYVVSDKEPFYPWAWGEVIFGTNEPTLERVVTVRAARNANLATLAENGIPEGDKQVGGDLETITWRMTDLPSYDFAEAANKAGRYMPRVSFSTCPDWDIFTAELQSRFDGAVDENSQFIEALSECEKYNDTRMTLESVVGFISDRIALKRFHEIGMLLSYRTADQTYSTGYGSTADFAVLYAAALKHFGFDAKVYLLDLCGLPVPGLTGEEEYSIHIENGSLQCRLEPAHGDISYLPPNDMTAIGISPAAIPKAIPASPFQKNSVLIDVEVNFSECGEADGWILLKSAGQMSMFDIAIADGADAVIGHLTDGLYTAPELENTAIILQSRDIVEAKADLKFAAAEDMIEGLLKIEMPWKVSDFHGLLPGGLETYQPGRDVPVYMGHAGSVSLNITFNLPEEWSVELLPEAFSENADGIMFTRNVTLEENSVTFTETCVFNKTEIPASSWDAWRHVLLQAEKASNRTLLLNTEG